MLGVCVFLSLIVGPDANVTASGQSVLYVSLVAWSEAVLCLLACVLQSPNI